MKAVEDSTPLYESVSERISLNQAARLRWKAVEWLSAHASDWVLDVGSGPGVSSRMLLERGFGRVVGLDPSAKLLNFARSRTGEGFHPVVGTSERLPFRSGAFGSILTCFALRDAQSLRLTLREFSRVVRDNGTLAIVDVGKPDRAFSREIVTLYVTMGMPVLARALVRNRLPTNPFRMIVPTFRRLLPNRKLTSLVEEDFGPARLKEFMRGGLVIIRARQRNGRAHDASEQRKPPVL